MFAQLICSKHPRVLEKSKYSHCCLNSNYSIYISARSLDDLICTLMCSFFIQEVTLDRATQEVSSDDLVVAMCGHYNAGSSS